jgi:nitroreductase
MFEDIDPNSTKVLNEILKARRTVRAFSGTPLDEKDVKLIVKAGLIAPFASIPAKGNRLSQNFHHPFRFRNDETADIHR